MAGIDLIIYHHQQKTMMTHELLHLSFYNCINNNNSNSNNNYHPNNNNNNVFEQLIHCRQKCDRIMLPKLWNIPTNNNYRHFKFKKVKLS